ncbi:MAG: PilZ domain-containing protein [Candidatus Omnitrophica bacterium]|nr:PilZ domain-containing protein [Candidatus Omnitrophota bacterium]MBD3269352.1 PilZ domain-containing protein [Candidatus Omnitrophota bacterium]
MNKNNTGGERRRFIRHPMCFPLKYKVLKRGFSKKREDYSSTKNISRGGLLFPSRYAVEPGSLILLKMPFQDKIFKVRGKVLHCNISQDTNLYEIGVSFQRYSDAFKVRLVEQLYLISEYRDLRAMQTGKDISLQEASREWISRYSKRFQRLYW